MQNRSISYSQMYFSTEGRIPRSTYWLKYYIPIIVLSSVAYILDYSFGTFNMELGYGIFSSILALLVIWPSIAIYVKRLHDRDRSGWFALLLFVPLVNIWIAIEIMFLKGTEGPNRFGEDPCGNTAKVYE